MKGLLPKKPQDEGTMTDELLTRNGLKEINSYLYLYLIAVLIIAISGIISPVSVKAKDLGPGIVVTEIMSFWSPNPRKPAVITKVYPARDWVEIYNPWETTIQLDRMTIKSQPNWNFDLENIQLRPGGYVHLCGFKDCGYADTLESFETKASVAFNDTDGIELYSHPEDNPEKVARDALAWGSEMEPLEGQPVSVQDDEYIRRKTSQSGCPIDTQYNDHDFESDSGTVSFKGYTHCPGLRPTELLEYIELHNASDQSIDPVASGYRIKDSLDAEGKSSDKWYKIVGFPSSNHSNETVLDPDQRALILPPQADTSVFFRDSTSRAQMLVGQNQTLWTTVYPGIFEDEVKLLTTKASDGSYQFLTGGLHNQYIEYLTLDRPGSLPPEINILRSDQRWDPPEVEKYRARIKINPAGSNTRSNWETKWWGTPGQVID